MNLLRKITAAFRRKKFETDMTEEMRAHVELQIAMHIKAGLDPEEARFRALREFGNVAKVQEECREQRGWVWLEHWARDFRLSGRSLRRSFGFSASVVITLALCIGANTTIMSVLYGLILKPMPFHDAGQLVEVYTSQPKNNLPKRRVSVAQYLDYKANADLFEGFALWTNWSYNIGEDQDPERGIGARVSADYFTLLGIQPLLGRFYTIEESAVGKDKVLVLTQTFWERKFRADPAVINRVIRLSGEPFTIIGVAPRSMEALNGDTTLIKPFEWSAQMADPQARAMPSAMVYARVKSGVPLSAAQAQLQTLEKRFQEQVATAGMRDFAERSGFRVEMGRVRFEQTKSIRTSLLMLQGGALFVLLLGCLNVANLMLARANSRQGELALRQALGAGRGALARQMLVEGLSLASAGALGGLALTWAGLRVVNTYTTAIVREVQPINLDGTMLVATMLVTLAVAVVIAMLPVFRTWRTNLLASMQGGSRATDGGAMRTASGFLVTSQIAAAMILLIGACLLLRSFAHVLAVDPGFDADRVVQGRTVFGEPGQTLQSVKSKQDLILSKMREIPGVENVAYVGAFPITKITTTHAFPIRGQTLGRDETFPQAAVHVVSPEYFEVMGIRLLEGRGFNASDTWPGARRVYVIDQQFAKKHFPGRSAVGEVFALGGPNESLEKLPIIIGVVASAKLGGLEDTSGTPIIFTPMGVAPAFSMLLRTERPAEVIVPLMREKLRSVDSSAPLYIVGSLREDIGEWQLTNRRGVMWLLGAFAGIALILSAVGIYGMLAYDVTQRTREIGIRGALGATRGQIIALILKQGILKTGIGLAVGLIGAFYLSRYLQTLLFEVKSTDALTYVVVTGLLALIASIASWLPARRAAKVDPMIALRAE